MTGADKSKTAKKPHLMPSYEALVCRDTNEAARSAMLQTYGMQLKQALEGIADQSGTIRFDLEKINELEDNLYALNTTAAHQMDTQTVSQWVDSATLATILKNHGFAADSSNALDMIQHMPACYEYFTSLTDDENENWNRDNDVIKQIGNAYGDRMAAAMEKAENSEKCEYHADGLQDIPSRKLQTDLSGYTPTLKCDGWEGVIETTAPKGIPAKGPKIIGSSVATEWLATSHNLHLAVIHPSCLFIKIHQTLRDPYDKTKNTSRPSSPARTQGCPDYWRCDSVHYD
jgi:hypothetical protein